MSDIRVFTPSAARTMAPIERETILMLHCSASDGRQWNRLVNHLEASRWARQRFELLAPDLCGYGVRGDAVGLSIAEQAERIASEQLGAPQRVHLVGHSFGGVVALHLATLLGERLASLTLAEPVAFRFLALNGNDVLLAEEVHELVEQIRSAYRLGQCARAMRYFIDYWNGDGGFDRLNVEVRDALSRHCGQVLQDFGALRNEPVRLAALSSLEAPVLVVRGRDTRAPTRRIAEHVARAVPRARLVSVPHAGHMFPVTHHDVFNALVAAHVARTRTQSLNDRGSAPETATGTQTWWCKAEHRSAFASRDCIAPRPLTRIA